MLAFAARIQEVRSRLGRTVGLAGQKYTVLIAIAHLQDQDGGVGINEIAAHLHLSGAFVTIETNGLIKSGLVAKRTNPRDRRRVLLMITPKAARLLDRLTVVQAPVNDGHQFTLRMNFPSRHALKGAGVVANADLVVGLEVPDFFHLTHALTPVNRFGMEARPTTKAGAKLVTISASDLLTKNNYQEAGRYTEADLAIPADAEATLPSLIEACRKLITPERRCACGWSARTCASAAYAGSWSRAAPPCSPSS